MREHRPCRDGGVELAVLAAGIDARRQVGEERGVEAPAREARIEPGGIDGDEMRLEPRRDDLVRQLVRVASPEREDRLHPGFGHARLAVGADILKEEVAEDHVADAIGGDGLERLGHAGLVDLVRAGPGQAHLDQRQAKRRHLRVEEARGACRASPRGRRPRSRSSARRPTSARPVRRASMQREGAVLPARPRQDRAGRAHGRQRRKLAMSRRPAAWLFSGWNWVPTMVPRPTMAVMSPP
jgi:hypothetical protein